MDQATLKSLLDYDPEAGIFRWKAKLGSRAVIGAAAGTLMDHGYVRISVDGHRYYAHRLVWMYVHGRWPDPEVDHANGVRHDNRLANLREADRHQNGANLPLKRNNTSGIAGVSWDRKTGKWAAYIMRERRKIGLGYHDDIFNAAAARRSAGRRYFGEFARS